MSGIAYYAVGLVIAVIGGGIAWLFRNYRSASEQKAKLADELKDTQEKLDSLREVADAQANPITDVNVANDIVRKRRKKRD